jgi:hypothetical protein
MQIPIAHGEGRFVTKDPELIAALQENDQIAFQYCDAEGKVSDDPSVTLNGSTHAIAGICNPAGNVVALMPHPERTSEGDPYFVSVRRWILENRSGRSQAPNPKSQKELSIINSPLSIRSAKPLEIFIDTIIVNNEERTVEAAARRVLPQLRLKQFRYLAPMGKKAEEVLSHLSHFNPNKEIAYVRRCQVSGVRCQEREWLRWNAERKALEPMKNPLSDMTLLRRDEPDTSAGSFGEGSETGVCYVCHEVSDKDLEKKELQEIFGNPHASILERMI